MQLSKLGGGADLQNRKVQGLLFTISETWVTKRHFCRRRHPGRRKRRNCPPTATRCSRYELQATTNLFQASDYLYKAGIGRINSKKLVVTGEFSSCRFVRFLNLRYDLNTCMHSWRHNKHDGIL